MRNAVSKGPLKKKTKFSKIEKSEKQILKIFKVENVFKSVKTF